jgi:hypothetical protein
MSTLTSIAKELIIIPHCRRRFPLLSKKCVPLSLISSEKAGRKLIFEL